jgi:hypothetical protein
VSPLFPLLPAAEGGKKDFATALREVLSILTKIKILDRLCEEVMKTISRYRGALSERARFDDNLSF